MSSITKSLKSSYGNIQEQPIVAIRRGTEISILPGPSAIIKAYDRIVVVDDSDVLERTVAYGNKCK